MATVPQSVFRAFSPFSQLVVTENVNRFVRTETDDTSGKIQNKNEAEQIYGWNSETALRASLSSMGKSITGFINANGTEIVGKFNALTGEEKNHISISGISWETYVEDLYLSDYTRLGMKKDDLIRFDIELSYTKPETAAAAATVYTQTVLFYFILAEAV